MTRRSVLLVLGLLWPALATAQEPPSDLPADWAAVTAKLAPPPPAEGEPESPAPDRAERIRILTEFLDRWSNREPPLPKELIDARLRLGALQLAGLECEAAAKTFAAAFDGAPESALDARGRALYGQAQAEVLRGDSTKAGEHLGRLQRDFLGTRWADHAKVAMKLLQPEPQPSLRVGRQAPEIGPRLDRSGRSQSLDALHGAPALLLFVSPLDEEGLADAERWRAAARRAGLPSENILIFAIDADTATIESVRGLRQLREPVLPTPAGFLDPALIRFRIDAVPSSVLIGPDGAYLARDLPVRRLESALRRLIRG